MNSNDNSSICNEIWKSLGNFCCGDKFVKLIQCNSFTTRLIKIKTIFLLNQFWTVNFHVWLMSTVTTFHKLFLYIYILIIDNLKIIQFLINLSAFIINARWRDLCSTVSFQLQFIFHFNFENINFFLKFIKAVILSLKL